jgi:hypothetical protein
MVLLPSAPLIGSCGQIAATIRTGGPRSGRGRSAHLWRAMALARPRSTSMLFKHRRRPRSTASKNRRCAARTGASMAMADSPAAVGNS